MKRALITIGVCCSALQMPTAAATWDDYSVPAEDPAFVAEQFETICVESNGSLSAALAISKEVGWQRAPDGAVDAYLGRTLPATRRGLVSEGHPGVFLSLSARGHHRTYPEGTRTERELPETYPVMPGKVSGDAEILSFGNGKPIFGETSVYIGSTACMMTGRVLNHQQLVDLVRPIFHPPGSSGEFTGKVSRADIHRKGPAIVSYGSNGEARANLQMQVSYPAKDGSVGFRLIYSKWLPVGTPVEAYSIPE